jgi:hypothetical protein
LYVVREDRILDTCVETHLGIWVEASGEGSGILIYISNLSGYLYIKVWETEGKEVDEK